MFYTWTCEVEAARQYNMVNIQIKASKKLCADPKFMHSPKTKHQIAHELGISLRTLQRWIKKSNLTVPRGLICPLKQIEIMEELGYLKKKTNAITEIKMSRNGTKKHDF